MILGPIRGSTGHVVSRSTIRDRISASIRYDRRQPVLGVAVPPAGTKVAGFDGATIRAFGMRAQVTGSVGNNGSPRAYTAASKKGRRLSLPLSPFAAGVPELKRKQIALARGARQSHLDRAVGPRPASHSGV